MIIIPKNRLAEKAFNLYKAVYALLRKTDVYVRDCYYIGPDEGDFKDKSNWEGNKVPNIFSKIIALAPNLPVMSGVLFPEIDCECINVPKHFPGISVIYGTINVKQISFAGDR